LSSTALARLAAQLLHGLIVLPAFGRAAVQGDDLIARLNPRALCGVSGSGATTVIHPSRTSIWMPKPP